MFNKEETQEPTVDQRIDQLLAEIRKKCQKELNELWAVAHAEIPPLHVMPFGHVLKRGLEPPDEDKPKLYLAERKRRGLPEEKGPALATRRKRLGF